MSYCYCHIFFKTAFSSQEFCIKLWAQKKKWEALISNSFSSPAVSEPPSSQHTSLILLPTGCWEWSLWHAERHHRSVRRPRAEARGGLQSQHLVWAAIPWAGLRGGNTLSRAQRPPPSHACLWGWSGQPTNKGWDQPSNPQIENLRRWDNVHTAKEPDLKGSLGTNTPSWGLATL